MVTYCVTKMISTCLPMIGQFFDAMIVADNSALSAHFEEVLH